MSLHDYETSARLERQGVAFYALVMAAMRRADSSNLDRLRRAFPEVHEELRNRYNAPGGLLPFERDFDAFEAARKLRKR